MEVNFRWYTRRDGKKEGSFSDAELCALIKQEILTEEDEIWTMKMQSWIKIKDSVYSFYLPQNASVEHPIKEVPEDDDMTLQVKTIR